MKAISNENMQKSISGLEGKVLASGYTLFESLLLILLLTTILSFPVLAFSAWKNELAVYQFSANLKNESILRKNRYCESDPNRLLLE